MSKSVVVYFLFSFYVNCQALRIHSGRRRGAPPWPMAAAGPSVASRVCSTPCSGMMLAFRILAPSSSDLTRDKRARPTALSPLTSQSDKSGWSARLLDRHVAGELERAPEECVQHSLLGYDAQRRRVSAARERRARMSGS